MGCVVSTLVPYTPNQPSKENFTFTVMGSTSGFGSQGFITGMILSQDSHLFYFRSQIQLISFSYSFIGGS